MLRRRPRGNVPSVAGRRSRYYQEFRFEPPSGPAATSFRLSEPAPRVAAILHLPLPDPVPRARAAPASFFFHTSANPMSSPDPAPADQFTPEMILDASGRADRDSTDCPSDAPRGPPDPPQPHPGPSTSTGESPD